MGARLFALLAATALCTAAFAQDADPQARAAHHADLVKQVQEKLNAGGFDAGPANGVIEGQTQAAVARFQLSIPIPASGQLDAQTLAELGIDESQFMEKETL